MVVVVVGELLVAMLTVSSLASPNIQRGAEQELFSTASTLANSVSRWDEVTVLALHNLRVNPT
jgi:hypothetical protein